MIQDTSNFIYLLLEVLSGLVDSVGYRTSTRFTRHITSISSPFIVSSPPPTWQFACAAYIPLLTGHLSVVGSSLIIYSMTRGGLKSEHCIKQLKHPQNRILLVMSCYDFVYSLVKAWTFLLAPTGYGVPGAQGNLTTCAMQGFFIQVSFSIICKSFWIQSLHCAY